VPPAVALLNYTYKLWYTLADFLPNWDNSRGFLIDAGNISEAAMRWEGRGTLYFLRGFFFILFTERIGEAAMGRTGVRGHNMINKKRNKKRAVLHLILILPKGTAKLRGGGTRGEYIFRVQHTGSSVRVQRSSEGCSLAQKGAA
jgi:hypothetical protein